MQLHKEVETLISRLAGEKKLSAEELSLFFRFLEHNNRLWQLKRALSEENSELVEDNAKLEAEIKKIRGL